MSSKKIFRIDDLINKLQQIRENHGNLAIISFERGEEALFNENMLDIGRYDLTEKVVDGQVKVLYILGPQDYGDNLIGITEDDLK